MRFLRLLFLNLSFVFELVFYFRTIGVLVSDLIPPLIFTKTMPLGVVSEFWLTRWLTGFWLVGVGVLAGLAILALLWGLFVALSKLSFLDSWRRNGVAFWLGLILSAAITGVAGYFLMPYFTYRTGFRNDEWVLFTIAIWPFFAIVVWSLLYCGQTRSLGELYGGLTQGIGSLLVSVIAAIGIAGLCCTYVVDEPVQMLASIPSLFTTGETTSRFTIPGIKVDGNQENSDYTPIPLKYDPTFVDSVAVQSDRKIILADGQNVESFRSKPLRMEARTEIAWNRQSSLDSPIPMVVGGNVYAQNLEIDPATITFVLKTVPAYPDSFTILLIAGAVVIIGLSWMLLQAAAPKVAAISIAAAKSELWQPLPTILLLFGSLALLLFVFLPFHTEGEDIKMLKDCGLTLVLVICLFQGVWSASSSVSDEIEGRTALTLLSKPIHRRSFILGKMIGIFWILLFMILILGTFLLLSVSYKPIYDARETSQDMPFWQVCHLEMVRILPGLVMVFLQASTLSAIAVALATRVPLLANFSICFTLYLVGHLTPSIVSSSVDSFPIVQFVAQLIAVIVPTLDWYSMDKAIDAGHSIPAVYLAGVLIYSALYTTFAVFLGLLLFEDRDLA